MQDRANELRRRPLLRLYEKGSSAGQAPHHEANHRRVHQRLPARTQPLVIHRLILLFWSIQAIVRSTTHLLGKTKKPLGGISFCQSASTPSLAHSLAHAIRAPLRELAFSDAPPDPRSTPGSSRPSRRPCPLLCSPRPATGGRGEETAPWLDAVAT